MAKVFIIEWGEGFPDGSRKEIRQDERGRPETVGDAVAELLNWPGQFLEERMSTEKDNGFRYARRLLTTLTIRAWAEDAAEYDGEES